MKKLHIKLYEATQSFPVPDDSTENPGIITTRLAAKTSKRQGFPTCKIHDPMVHSSASDLNAANRDKNKSFTWTGAREPNARAVSP